MSPTLFILAVTFYLVSMVAGLIAAFFVKHISPRFINTLIIFHILVFLCWLLMRNENDTLSHPGNSNYLFLAFFCSGVFTAGMLLRSGYPVFLKIYYVLYLLSLVVFVVAPSRLLGFITSGNIYSISPSRYHIGENYFLVEQQLATGSGASIPKSYKIVREMGMFHKTLARNVVLPGNTDSVKLLGGNVDEQVQLRAFFKAGNEPDSLDLTIVTGQPAGSTRDIKQIRK